MDKNKELEESLKEFNDSTEESLKENLKLSLLGFMFAKLIEDTCKTDAEKHQFKHLFINTWKKGVTKLMNESVSGLDKKIKKDNLDFINIIMGHIYPTTEDYHKSFVNAIKESEKLYWKLISDGGDNPLVKSE